MPGQGGEERVDPDEFTNHDRKAAQDSRLKLYERLIIAGVITFFYLMFGLLFMMLTGPLQGMILGGIIAGIAGHLLGTLFV